MPRRVRTGLADPIRRRNLAARIVEGYCGGLAVLVGVALHSAWLFGSPWSVVLLWLVSAWETWAMAALAPLAEFVVYEFLLEPLGWSGHFWERGPRDGEVFTYW